MLDLSHSKCLNTFCLTKKVSLFFFIFFFLSARQLVQGEKKQVEAERWTCSKISLGLPSPHLVWDCSQLLPSREDHDTSFPLHFGENRFVLPTQKQKYSSNNVRGLGVR